MVFRKTTKRIRRIAGLWALLLMASGTVPAWGQSWDGTRAGSLVVNTSYVTGSGDGQKRDPVKDVEISLYQVAAASLGETWVEYTSKPGLEPYQPFFNSGFSGEDNAAAAEELQRLETLSDHQVQTAVKTDKDGNAVFSGLEPGLYLVVQSAKKSGFYEMGPFLTPVPSQAADGTGWVYDVEARPKLEKKPGGGDPGDGGGTPPDPVTPTVPQNPTIPEEVPPLAELTPQEDFPTGKLPQTGMHRAWMLALICAGVVCFGAGCSFKGNKKKWFLFSLGVLGLLGAGAMEGKNLLENRNAGQASAEAVAEIREWIAWAEAGNAANQDNQAGDSQEAANQPAAGRKSSGAALLTAQSGYAGILSIPSLGLELPVQDEWSYPALRKTPCRYYGAAKAGDLVVFAHNYERHFGNIKDMETEDEVFFTDMDGQLHSYAVDEVMVISPYEAETMTAGEWDLILFTCTYGGENRVAVRCREMAEKGLENW